MPQAPDAVIALDVGQARIGVAIASAAARLPRPLATLANDDRFLERLKDIVKTESVGRIIIGWPRDMQGNTTPQTRLVEAFARDLQQSLALPLVFQDEAVTSVRAEAELRSRGKIYEKGDIDALAATYILEDYLKHEELKH
jgi:putative Holliday junction resolvase